MAQNVLLKQIVYKGHKIYKHREGSRVYYSVPALSDEFRYLKDVKIALDKLDRHLTKAGKESRGGRRK